MRVHPTQVRRPRGFTLVEVLTVILIVGLTTSLVVIQMGGRGPMQATAAARAIVSDLQYAQNYAIAHQTTVYIDFDTDGVQHYSVLSQHNPSEVMLPHPVTRKPWQVEFGDQSSSVMAGTQLNYVGFDGFQTMAFNALGEPLYIDSCDDCEKDLTWSHISLYSGDSWRYITVQPFTGSVDVW